MRKNLFSVSVGFAVGAFVSVHGVSAQALGTNLVVNGDAELGTIDGWVDGGIEAVDSAGAGVLGLPVGVTIGGFSFVGGLGPELQTLSQSIDVNSLAGPIDAGQVTSVFTGLLQDRAIPGARDTAAASIEFRDSSGAALDVVTFRDTSAPFGVFDWEAFSDQRVVPAGTRELWVELSATRTVGVSSDGFMDNISIVLSMACYADCDTSTGAGTLDIFDFLCFQNSFVAGEPYACDCDTTTGTGVCDIFDFLCFQNAFVAGCP
jgi:hypothetical protein